MDDGLRARVLQILDQHRIMSVATNRRDGWPQATTVGYVNIGLTLYFLCSADSQKAKNLTRDKRVSLTIDHDASDPMEIAGLSMAAEADIQQNPSAIQKALSLLYEKYPEYGAFRAMQLDNFIVYRLTPKIISVIDYAKGFGHADLITF